MATMKVFDIKTRATFDIEPTEDRVTIKTSDGEKVRLHPASLRVMVKKGGKFNGHTLTGTREMIRKQ